MRWFYVQLLFISVVSSQSGLIDKIETVELLNSSVNKFRKIRDTSQQLTATNEDETFDPESGFEKYATSKILRTVAAVHKYVAIMNIILSASSVGLCAGLLCLIVISQESFLKSSKKSLPVGTEEDEVEKAERMSEIDEEGGFEDAVAEHVIKESDSEESKYKDAPDNDELMKKFGGRAKTIIFTKRKEEAQDDTSMSSYKSTDSTFDESYRERRKPKFYNQPSFEVWSELTTKLKAKRMASEEVDSDEEIEFDDTASCLVAGDEIRSAEVVRDKQRIPIDSEAEEKRLQQILLESEEEKDVNKEKVYEQAETAADDTDDEAVIDALEAIAEDAATKSVDVSMEAIIKRTPDVDVLSVDPVTEKPLKEKTVLDMTTIKTEEKKEDEEEGESEHDDEEIYSKPEDEAEKMSDHSSE